MQKSIILLFLVTFINISAQFEIKLNLSNNQQYELYHYSEVFISQFISGQKINTYTEILSHTTYEVLEKSDSIYLMNIIFRDIEFIMSSPKLKMVINTKDSSMARDKFWQYVSGLVGKSFQIKMNHFGEILEIIGFDSLVLNTIADIDFPQATKSLFEASLKKLNSLSPAQSFERISKYDPKQAVSIGDTWDIEGEVELGLTLKFSRHVKFETISNNKYMLKSNSVIKDYDTGKDNILSNTTFHLNGQENYNIQLDIISGWFEEVEGKIELNGIGYFNNSAGSKIEFPISITAKDYYGTKPYYYK